MRSYRQAIAVALATFVASIFGMGLRLVVPAQVLNDFKATIGGMAGLITLLLALVLGLLVYTAFTVYSTQQSEAQGLGAGGDRVGRPPRAVWARGPAWAGRPCGRRSGDPAGGSSVTPSMGLRATPSRRPGRRSTG